MQLKLTVELIPRPLVGLTLRRCLSAEDWRYLSRWCESRAGYQCEICGGAGEKDPVVTHESWTYDDTEKIQILTGVIALCPDCHRVKQYHSSCRLGFTDSVRRHFQQVNNCSQADLERHEIEVTSLARSRSVFPWLQDLSWLQKREWLSTLPNTAR